MRILVWRVFHALGVTAIGLIAGTAVAHVFEMPHKLAMTEEVWLPIQSVLYNGWGAKLIYLDLLAFAALGAVIYRFPTSRLLAGSALGLVLVADVAIFMIWIAPTNAALDAWTGAVPMKNWASLRANWEWGHAARAIILALATAMAAMAAPRIP